MPRIITRLNHHHRHSGVSDPVKGDIHQSRSNTPSLVIRIHGQNVDLTHVILRVDSNADEPNNSLVILRNPKVGLAAFCKRFDLRLLAFPPSIWIKSIQDEGISLCVQFCEDRRPSPLRKRQDAFEMI